MTTVLHSGVHPPVQGCKSSCLSPGAPCFLSPGPGSLPPLHSLGWLGRKSFTVAVVKLVEAEVAEGRPLYPRASVKVSERVGTLSSRKKSPERITCWDEPAFPFLSFHL